MADKFSRDIFRIFASFLLGLVILWWMYRDTDWPALWNAVDGQMKWTWMWLSMPFGVLAQLLRAFRWRQSLEPFKEPTRISVCINAIFVSYAASLLLPRIGEVLRCGLQKKCDGTSFMRSLGTVVTERIVDSVLMILLTLLAIGLQLHVFSVFFSKTGVSFFDVLGRFTATGYCVTAFCVIVMVVFLFLISKKVAFMVRTHSLLNNIIEGLTSLHHLHNVPLYILYSLGIWVAYFFHFYLTFFCFPFTSCLGLSAAFVAFVVGTIAVIVPTPNGAGPWHFAVKTILVLYGVSESNGIMFVLVVHTLQTLLVVLLGIYGAFALSLIKSTNNMYSNDK